MINNSVLMGRLVKSPSIRQTAAGPVCNFSIACQRNYKAADGTRPVDYIDIVAFRGLAEHISKWYSKGRMAIVSGRIQTRDWVDQSGQKRHTTEIIANSIDFGDSRPQDKNPVPTYSDGNTATEPDRADMQDSGRDLPF